MKKIIPNVILILLFLFVAGIFIYDHIILKKPYEDNILKMVLVVASLVVSLIRINKKDPERPLWVYEKIYKDNLENVFLNDKISRRKLLSGIKLFDEEKYSKAKDSFEKLLAKCKENEDYSAVCFFIGVCYDRLGLEEDAVEYYERAIEYNPQNISAYNNAASYYQGKGDVEKAIAYYLKAIGNDREYVKGYSNLSNCYLNLGDYVNAEFYAKKALEIEPKFKYPALNLAVVYAIEGDLEKRKKYTSIAVKNGYSIGDVEATIYYYKSLDSIDESEYEDFEE